MNEQTTKLKKMPLWQWVLLFIVSTLLFMLLYMVAIAIDYEIDYFVQNVLYYFACGTIILSIYASWRRWVEKEKPHDLYQKDAVKNLLVGLSIGFLFFSVTAVVLIAIGCCKITLAPAISWSLLLMVFANYLLVAIGEEVVFRGFIFRMIRDRFGFISALIVSSLAFGLIHLSNPGATLWSSIAISIEAGLLLGATYQYSRSLWLPIGIHWAWNFSQGNIYGFLVSGCESSESIFNSVLSGSELITGGTFGPEASIITIILGLLFSIYYIHKSV